MPNDIVPYDEAREMAKTALHSRIFGLQNMEEAVVKYAAAKELGIGYTAGLEYLQVIQGKLTITPRGMLALAIRCADIRYNVAFTYESGGSVEACTVSGYRLKNGRIAVEHVETFSMSDARRAGLIVQKGNWEKYPKNMLKWRAIGFWLDVVCPDVIFLKRQDEFTDQINAVEFETFESRHFAPVDEGGAGE